MNTEYNDLEEQVAYYEALLDYLGDMIPNLSDVIEQFEEENK